MSSKQEQRNTAKKLRLDIKKDLYQAYSDTICLKIMNMDEYARANTVMAYCPINNEVDTSLLLEDCIESKKLALPKTDAVNKTIMPCLVKSLADLKEGSYRIMEPSDSCEILQNEEIDLIIIPLVAFDKRGTRLGYGGGYYDRLLKNMQNVKKIGIAFAVQELDSIPKEEHDVRMDMVITEKKTFNF